MRAIHPLAGIALLVSGTLSASETVSYSYDAKGRLTDVVHSGSANNGVTQKYVFDRADNRTNVNVTGGAFASVADFSFEDPGVGSGYSYNPAVSGASFAANTGVAGNGSGWGFAAAPNGSQVGFVQAGSSSAGVIGLSVSGLAVGATYRVSFRIAQRPGYPANQVAVAFQGTSLGTFTPSSTSFQAAATAWFTATATSGTLTFTGQVDPSADHASGIDDIRLELSP